MGFINQRSHNWGPQLVPLTWHGRLRYRFIGGTYHKALCTQGNICLTYIYILYICIWYSTWNLGTEKAIEEMGIEWEYNVYIILDLLSGWFPTCQVRISRFSQRCKSFPPLGTWIRTLWQAPDLAGHARTPTTYQKECQIECQRRCQKERQNRREIECQKQWSEYMSNRTPERLNARIHAR